MTENITKKRQPSCDKCFHYGICPTWDSWNDKPYADGYSDGCQKYSNFKDKSLIIELPCEVGTELFLSDYLMAHHRLKEYKFIGTRVVMVIECFEFRRTCRRFLDEHFGKTVFLTREDAEKAMLNNKEKEGDR